MSQIQSIHTVYRPQPTSPAPYAPPTNNGGYPAYPTYPQQPTDNWGGQQPGTYPGTYPGTNPGTYPGTYPGQYPTQPAPAQGQSTLSKLARYVGGVFAGRNAAGIMKKATAAARRSRSSRVYRDAYGTPIRRYSSGRPRVGTAGRAGSQFFGAVKTSIIVGSLVSIATNVWDMVQKRQTFAQGASNIVGDVMSSAVGGVGAAAGSAIGTALFAGMLSSTGLMLPLVGMAFGVVGFAVADGIFRNTGIFKGITSKVSTMFGGPQTYTPTPSYPGYPTNPGYPYAYQGQSGVQAAPPATNAPAAPATNNPANLPPLPTR